MFTVGLPRCSLRLGSQHAVWAELSRDWTKDGRGRARCRYRLLKLPQGLLKPSPIEPNISEPETLIAQLRDLIGVSETPATLPRSAVVVVPDLSVRTTLLTWDAVPPRATEREALIRWRLEKEGTFPMAGARIVSQVLDPHTVLAVMITEGVLGQYESLCEAVGLAPVLVETPSLLLGSLITAFPTGQGAPLTPSETVGALSLLDEGLAFVLYHDGRPVFLRTKVRSRPVIEDLASSVALFAESHPDRPLRRLMLLSEEPESSLAPLITKALELEVSQVGWGELQRAGAVWATDAVPLEEPPLEALPAALGLLPQPRKNMAAINLSRRRYNWPRSARAGLLLASLLFVLVMVWDLRQAWTLQAQLAEMAHTLARVQEQDQRLQRRAQGDGGDLSEATLARLPRDIAFANHMLAKRAFSWTRFMSTLEEAVPPRVAIHSIKLEGKDAAIALTGTAMTLKDLTALVISLEDHAVFQGAVLTHHRVVDHDLVEFALTVRYRSQDRSL